MTAETVIRIPVLETDRLVLRAPRLEDFAPYCETLFSDRARHIGGPFDVVSGWRDYSEMVASWILRGYGPWSLEEKATGAFAGFVILHHPAYDPEPELGWILQAEAEGRGLAYEAALRARAFAYGDLGWRTVVSYIDRKNSRSIRLAERLGATLDDGVALMEGDDSLVYRHPAPERLQ